MEKTIIFKASEKIKKGLQERAIADDRTVSSILRIITKKFLEEKKNARSN